MLFCNWWYFRFLNDEAPYPREKYVNWDNRMSDGGRAWILPQSGTSDFANNMYVFQFEELQIYGNGHLAVLNPGEITVFDAHLTFYCPS
jgi:hypothetical protein